MRQAYPGSSILKKEGLHISAVQNHYSLLNRSSEESGILDYCKGNDKVTISFCLQVHHSICDGCHAGQFFTYLQKPAGEVEEWM